MKEILIITKPDCIACTCVVNLIHSIFNEHNGYVKDITLTIDEVDDEFTRDIAYHSTNVPIIIFKNNNNEVARLYGTWDVDFYKNVIEKFNLL